MPETDRLFLWLATATYAAAVLYACTRLAGRRQHSHSITYPLIAAGVILQTTGLYLRGMEIGGCPLGNTFEIIQFVLWSTIFLFLVVGPVFRVNLLGTASATLVCIGSLVTLLIPDWDRPHTRTLFGGDPLIEFHAAVSIFSYGVFGLLATVSALYLLQYLALGRKWKSSFFNFIPSIVQLDDLSRRLLAAGLIVLTLAFVSGIVVWFEEAWEQLHLKLMAVVLLWIGYGLIWSLRLRARISPQRSAILFIVLFVLALLSLWPVKASVPENSATDLRPSTPLREPHPARQPGPSVSEESAR